MAKQAKSKKQSPKQSPAKAERGRPTSYKPEYVNIAYVLCTKGFTDKALAESFGVSEQTLNAWKHEHPEFLESLKRGKDEFDTQVVEAALLKTASGFEFTEDAVIRKSNGETQIKKVKKFQVGNVIAQIFWLKNRNSARWKDKQEVEHSGEIATPALVVNVAK